MKQYLRSTTCFAPFYGRRPNAPVFADNLDPGREQGLTVEKLVEARRLLMEAGW